MPLPEARTMIDFGLVVLIWLVQLIIYPSFRYMGADAFSEWHPRYSTLISIVVIPLMVGQVAIVGYQLYTTPGWVHGISALLIVLVWMSTFFQAVPIHEALGADMDRAPNIERLIRVNWNRTVLWSMIFVVGLFFARP